MNKLTLQKLQKKVKEWINLHGFKWSAYADYCHLVEEVGELGEALIVKHGEREPGDGALGLADHFNLEEEIGDVLYNNCYHTRTIATIRYFGWIVKHLCRPSGSLCQ